MSFPHWPITIRMTVQGEKEADDVVLEYRRLLAFPPMEGLKVELWREEAPEDEEHTTLLTLEELVYSFAESSYIVELEDENAVREGKTYQSQLISFYQSFGFIKLTRAPVAYIIRKEA